MSIPKMNYPQYRKARRLTRECCNNVGGNCLPLNAVLCAEIAKDHDHLKLCCECGASFTPKSNRAKYCPACAKKMRRQKEAERQRKRYHRPTHLEG